VCGSGRLALEQRWLAVPRPVRAAWKAAVHVTSVALVGRGGLMRKVCKTGGRAGPYFACAAAVAIVAVATAALAQTADLPAGLQALHQGDNAQAVRLFSQALASTRLSRAESERAYAARAQAFLASGDATNALADARRALVIDPNDDAAAGVRQKAQIALVAQGPSGQDPSQAADAVRLNAEAKARAAAQDGAAAEAYQASLAGYHADLARYGAQTKAEQEQHDAEVADYQAKLKAAEVKRQADLAAWQASVAACKKGDRTQCAKP
jgi:hypothetical protein